MEILEYTSEMQTELATCYNDLVANVPHCYPVTQAELDSVLIGDTDETEDKGRVDAQGTWVAREKGNVLGFIQAGIEPFEGYNEKPRGVIRFFGYRPRERQSAQALLEKAEVHLTAYTPPRIVAFPQPYRYRFYHFRHAYLSDTLAQVQAHLGYNGYQRKVGEVFLAWNDYTLDLTLPKLEVALSVKAKPSKGQRPNLTVQAIHQGEEIGVCESVSAGEFSDHPDAQDWFHTTWLYVDDEFQGQGLGRYLLQYTLHEMRLLGYRNAAISTNWENYRALLFYSNFGYGVSDWTHGFEKTQP